MDKAMKLFQDWLFPHHITFRNCLIEIYNFRYLHMPSRYPWAHMTHADLCAVKQHSAELLHSPHIVSNSLDRKQSKRHTEFKDDFEAEKWGFKQRCPTWMQIAVCMLPQVGNQEWNVQYYRATVTSDTNVTEISCYFRSQNCFFSAY